MLASLNLLDFLHKSTDIPMILQETKHISDFIVRSKASPGSSLDAMDYFGAPWPYQNSTSAPTLGFLLSLECGQLLTKMACHGFTDYIRVFLTLSLFPRRFERRFCSSATDHYGSKEWTLDSL